MIITYLTFVLMVAPSMTDYDAELASMEVLTYEYFEECEMDSEMLNLNTDWHFYCEERLEKTIYALPDRVEYDI